MATRSKCSWYWLCWMLSFSISSSIYCEFDRNEIQFEWAAFAGAGASFAAHTQKFTSITTVCTKMTKSTWITIVRRGWRSAVHIRINIKESVQMNDRTYSTGIDCSCNTSNRHSPMHSSISFDSIHFACCLCITKCLQSHLQNGNENKQSKHLLLLLCLLCVIQCKL